MLASQELAPEILDDSSGVVGRTPHTLASRELEPEATEPPNNCSGVVVDWPLDLDLKLNQTFPFHRVPIGRSRGDLPFYIEVHDRGEKIIAWSNSCTRQPTPYSAHCHECDGIPRRIDRLADIAAHAERHTNYQYLNHAQTRDLLNQRTEENNDLKLAVLAFPIHLYDSLVEFFFSYRALT